MQLAAGIICYNDSASLRRTLDSLPPKWVDHIFVIYGKFPKMAELPYDGTLELAKSYSHVKLSIATGAGHIGMRNIYLNMCARYDVDYLLIIDSDEYVTEPADWQSFRLCCLERCKPAVSNIYGVTYYNRATGGYSILPRLWYKPYEMEYYKAHKIFRHKGRGDIFHSSNAAAGKPIIEGITIKSDSSLRTKQFELEVNEYQAWQALFEKQQQQQ